MRYLKAADFTDTTVHVTPLVNQIQKKLQVKENRVLCQEYQPDYTFLAELHTGLLSHSVEQQVVLFQQPGQYNQHLCEQITDNCNRIISTT